MKGKFAQAAENNEENMSGEHTQSVNRWRISGIMNPTEQRNSFVVL